MLKPGGYATVSSPDGIVEADTFTCIHCNTVVVVPVKVSASDMGGFCTMCMKPVCGPCADLGKCIPFEKKLEAIERADRLHQSVSKEMQW